MRARRPCALPKGGSDYARAMGSDRGRQADRAADAAVRPRSLAEVASRGAALGRIDSWLREFLDEFYAARDPVARSAMLADEPSPLDDRRADAYLAAVAEHLSLRNGLPVPAWALQSSRFLHRPYFPCGLESLKATLLAESPTAFRRRLIFVGADPLYRPRRDRLGIGAESGAGGA